jgi:2-polyprenyl-3-methyl-5-hydroxy-6-metoxy-1,4-benzoquinol methylase
VSYDLVSVDCDLCGSDRRRLLLIENDLSISRCLDCSLIYVSRRPRRDVNEDVNYFVNAEHIKTHAARYEEVFSKYVAEITKMKPERGKLLDVGCGFGLFMKRAQENGWDVFGVDVSRNATEYAGSSLRLSNVARCEVEHAPYERNSFDCVTLWNVIEHVPSPTSVLRECRTFLKNDGLIVIRVPNIAFVSRVWSLRHVLRELQAVTGANLPGWSSSCFLAGRPPHHLFGFTPNTLKKALTKTEFVNVSVHPAILSKIVTRSKLYKLLGLVSRIAYRISFGNAIMCPSMTAFAYKA